MKIKPNTEQFKPNKDPSAFLESGAADVLEKKPQSEPKPEIASHQAITPGKIHREQKIFRLSVELINELKKQSYERSVAAGIRVTETELVENALRAYFDK